ncbi:MAG TPA: SNF2-related protein, partial [Rubrivivax sp.]|nr:SNF2-related protein [Rubrivivax sp.]
MARRPSPLTFVDVHGRPLGAADALVHTVKQAAEEARADELAAALAPADRERVFDALVLAGWRRSKTALVNFLRALQWTRERGGQFGGAEVGAALRLLHGAGRVVAHEGEGWSVPAATAEARLGSLLRDAQTPGWWRAWLWVAAGAYGPMDRVPSYFTPRDRNEAMALLRLVLAGGIDAKTYASMQHGVLVRVNLLDIVFEVLAQLLRLELFDRVHAPLLWALLGVVDEYGLLERAPALLQWVERHLDEAPAQSAAGLRLRVAEHRLHRGDFEGAGAAIAGEPAAAPFLPLLESLRPALQGRFDETAAAFPPAWKALGAHLGKRRGFAPQSLLQCYPLALMARPDAQAWATARKFCIAQSGSRTPPYQDPWGLWAHALAVRLGDERLEPDALKAEARWGNVAADPDRQADRLVLAAWLAQAPKGWRPALLQSMVDGLHAAGLAWKADLVLQACHQLGLPLPARPADAPPPWPVAYFRPRQDAWREALAAITALGEGGGASADKPLPTLRWRLSLDREGRVHDLQAFEPAATARGKPKPLTPMQMGKRTRLDPRDAAVARALRPGRHRASDVSFDLVQAVQALQGHPALVFDDAPEIAVELVEGLPVLELRRQRRGAAGAADSAGGNDSGDAGSEERPRLPAGEHFVFHLHDPVLAESDPELDHHRPGYDQIDAEIERRNGVRIVRDSPERARLIRITPAHRRVAELVAQRWTVPVDAGAELDAALRVLTGHFVVHSDAAAGEPVAADARLLARLQPRGDALRLTLAVRPFGDLGPALAPGQGRARLMTLHRGVSLATERDLDAERGHLATVFERLPFLAAADDELPVDGSWLLEDPEQALAAVHQLGELAAAAASVRAIEWPQGRPVRVLAPDAKAFATTLASGRDWFALDGQLQLDEGRVLSLQQLLGLLRDAQGSRYVALGEGQYLRLADQLRQRLAELDALAETRADGLKLGCTAGVWLADAAGELGLNGDAAWRRRAADLERAAALEPAVPPGLQAALRPYQAEGYVWLRRLAEAGFGAILADDMGLGKTVQTLALLLARAAAGPALVVAPTSVADNWAAETVRFAPGLRCAVYGRGEGERAAQIEAAAAGDVLVVSYALLLRDADAFAARPWATLVLDEAQALKNAATQRVQAVAALQAGFRLALSGTPVENRLADLWSIMNLLNPGLLGSAARFAERFANPIERQRSEAARARLRRLVSPFLLRRTKAQVLT